MFVWAGIPATYRNGFEASDELLERAAVFITPGGVFGKAGKKYIRVSLCSPVQKLDEAIQRIKNVL